MSSGEIIGAIVIALVIGGLFYYGFKSTGPWGSFWTFFVVLFFGIWIAALWANPVGPLWWGIAWFDLFLVGLLFALLLAAATPTRTRHTGTREHIGIRSEPTYVSPEERHPVVGISIFFWAMIVLFIVIIGAFYILSFSEPAIGSNP